MAKAKATTGKPARRNGVRPGPQTDAPAEDATPASPPPSAEAVAGAVSDLVSAGTTAAATLLAAQQELDQLPGDFAAVAAEAAASVPPARPPHSNGAPPSNGASHLPSVHIDELTARAILAAQESLASAKLEIRTWPNGAPGLFVYACLPEEFRDKEAEAFLSVLNEQQAALVGAWMSRQFWDGYALGHRDRSEGKDLRVP